MKCIVVALSLTARAWGAVAHAQSERPSARLRYERDARAAQCPDEQDLRDAVSARLGYVPFDHAAAVSVSVRFARRAGTLEASVSVDVGDGSEPRTRTLTSPSADCEQLATGVALAVSIAIDPLSLTRPEPPPAPEPATVPEPTPEPLLRAPEPVEPAPLAPASAHQGVPHDAPAPATEPPDRAPRTWRMGADLLGTVGATPSLTAALAGTVMLRATLWSGALEIRGDYPAVGDDARTSRALAQAVPCVHVRWAFACACLSAGVLRARGEGVEPERTAHALYAAAGSRVGIELPLTHGLMLRGYGEAVGTLTQIALEVAEREVWRTNAGALSIGLGLLGAIP